MSVSLEGCKFEHIELSIYFQLFNDECVIVKEAQVVQYGAYPRVAKFKSDEYR